MRASQAGARPPAPTPCDSRTREPRVILAAPVAQPPSVRHSASSSGPAARWIAPSTPPPPKSDVLAALTMASTPSVVMSVTMTSSRALAIWRAGKCQPSGRGSDRNALVGKQLLQFAGLEHLADDVAAADELALDVELRNRWPVRIGLDAVAQLGRFKDVEALVADPDVVENLHHLAGETALRKLRRSLHEQHDVVRLHFLVDELLDAHLGFLFPAHAPCGMAFADRS